MSFPKVALGLFGLYLLIGPGHTGGSAAYHQGQVFAEVLGGFLLILAVVPLKKSREGIDPDRTEEL